MAVNKTDKTPCLREPILWGKERDNKQIGKRQHRENGVARQITKMKKREAFGNVNWYSHCGKQYGGFSKNEK